MGGCCFPSGVEYFPHVILVSLRVFFSIQNVLMPNVQKLREHRFYANSPNAFPWPCHFCRWHSSWSKAGEEFSRSCQLGRRLCTFPPTIFGESDQRFVQNFSCIVCWLWVWVCRISPKSRSDVSQLLMSWRRSWHQLQFSHRQMCHSLFRCFVMPHCRGLAEF